MRVPFRAAFASTLRNIRPRGISVVINTLDRADMLSRVLESLSRQTYRNFEVVVVNGPSGDHTASVLQRQVGHIKMATCREPNLGRSRNIGPDLAAGAIVAFLDDDAEPEPEWLDKLNAAFDAPEVGAAGGFVFDVPLGRIEWRICTSTRAGEVTTNAPPPISRYLGPGADPFLYLAGCNMSFRRAALVAVGGFNEQLTYGYDDVEICCRLIDQGWTIAIIEDALVRHHRAPNATRDAAQVIRDPYPLVRARLIFAMQHMPRNSAAQDAAACARGLTDAWGGAADALRASGIFSQAAFDRFVDRLEIAVRDGLSCIPVTRPFRHVSTSAGPLKRFRA